MGELIQAQSVIQQLPATLQPFVSARIGEKQIKNLTPNEVKKRCVDILTKASSDMNSPMASDAKMLQIQTEALYSELSGKYKDLTLTELSEAFRRGIRGEFGPYFGLCAKTYHDFIKSYFNLPERQKAQLDYLNLIAGHQTVEKPKALQMIFSKEAILKVFSDYKEYGRLPIGAYRYYELIKEFKGLNSLMTKETYAKLLKEVLADEESKLLSQKKREEKKGNLSMAEAVMGVIAGLDGKDKSVEREIKSRGLKLYFDSLIKENKDLEL
jgi:chromosome segregation and condensation protein ScpB